MINLKCCKLPLRVLETAEERDYYGNGNSMKIAFIMDGGPKV